MSRKRSSFAEDIIAGLGKVPWWVGVLLAAVSYAGLRALSGMPPPDLAKTGPGGAPVLMLIGVASVATYVIPLLCLAGAIVSAVGTRKRRQLVDQAQGAAASAIDGMTWREFEQLVGEAFRLQGYTVTETGGGGADGGIDLLLRKGGDTYLVQCKQWRAFRVGVTVVRELYGVMAAKGAAGGFVVTSGTFTDDAKAFAAGRNVGLIDGPVLTRWLRDARLAKPARISASARPAAQARAPAASMTAAETPACPTCSRPMVRRTATEGATAGRVFWGCPSFPACRGTRAAEQVH
jgi:restriction system protein